ncbi:tetratricopeptide repeat protein [Hoeflea ulvae]|uniref:Tetratricopeptide repeat protein n=1 Tax=Hoeflea ulvae TaxID=2983764 RepID=A0ABT3YK19_9HYPH|nr:tetratricopeptide repeat protein [Hoeflea ulvae]MCY0096090.1 tetratricopeptide repeat protein [Hoeflea ulvae]
MADANEQTPLSAGAAVVRNPLSVIAMFVLLVEAISTITLVQVNDTPDIARPLVWFVVMFPTLIGILFFATIWWRHQYLYSPMEYRSDESFLTAMRRLQRVEARQEAADLNPRTADETQSLKVVDRLLQFSDMRAAVKVGRTFLEAGQFDIAVRIFQYILDKTPEMDDNRYNALANLGYAQIGMGQHKEAIETLERCIALAGKDRIGPWHLLALAYAHFKLSQSGSDAHARSFKSYLRKGKTHPWFGEKPNFYKQLYPEIADQL